MSAPLCPAHCVRFFTLASAGLALFTVTSAIAYPLAMPHFGAPHVVAWDPYSLPFGVGLMAGGESSWMIDDMGDSYAITSDDGIEWKTGTYGFENDDTYLCRSASATDGIGNFVTFGFVSWADPLFTRSQDGGQTWTAPAWVKAPEFGLFQCGQSGADIGGTSSGTWIAAWGYDFWDYWGITYTRIAFSRSVNSGATWSDSAIVAFDSGEGVGGFDLETDGHGTWVLMWMDDGIRFVRSTDDGATWSVPQTLATVVGLQSWSNNGIKIAADGHGSWVAVVVARFHAGDTVGPVSVLRSSDGGGTWSDLQALEPNEQPDYDHSPAIATDSAGNWVAAWAGGSGLEVAVSTDVGATWSSPELVETGEFASPSFALAHGLHGWMLAWHRHNTGIMVAAADATCGNEQVEMAEVCDDGNTADDDGCDSNCRPSGCGNGIINEGEECDDGNTLDDDYCPADCFYLHCGNGIVEGPEVCDDGNTVDTDGCTTACTYARCGDGFAEQGFEQCDPPDGQKCNPWCELAVCGDGYLQSWSELCDDGNTIDDDACPNDCSRATCGDGQTAYLVEECDWADAAWANQCTKACQTVDLCGDVDGDGSSTIADPLRILQNAVGLPVECQHDLCDINRDGDITVTDAQRALKRVVGLEPARTCSIGTGSIVFWIENRRSMAALQLDIDYRFTGGEFRGSGANVACESIDAPRSIAFNDDDREGHAVLTVGMIDSRGFGGPLDLFRCDFELLADRSDARFAIHVTDAVDTRFQNLDPPPLIGYRLE